MRPSLWIWAKISYRTLLSTRDSVPLTRYCPVSILWFYSRAILVHLVEDADTARLASLYLKVLIPSIPGYVLFETGKRFLQAQGLFRATTYILLVAAPCRAAILRLLVRELGFIGAPIAVGITRTFIPVLLLVYVKFIKGSACWVVWAAVSSLVGGQ